ncbi:MAG: 50S ribosomal protein L10 [Proteobacteria bacterium]|nr:50S ribosomal protein L10 [Pseudomonadota bacterium]
MNINDKKQCVEQVKQKFDASRAFFITHNLGLKAADITALRREIKANGGEFKVVKNTLIRKAIAGKPYSKDVDGDLNGPVAIAFSYKDPAAVAKAMVKYIDEKNRFQVMTGIMGADKLSSKDVIALSKLPGRDELIATAVRTIAAPLQSFMGVLTAVPRDFLNVLTAIKDKK